MRKHTFYEFFAGGGMARAGLETVRLSRILKSGF
jgi:hypothetical protein